MPAKSQAQRGYLASNFGEKWMVQHHFNNKGKLPYKVGNKKARKRGKRRARK